MKTCIQCGEAFKPQGRQKVCGGCKNAMQKGEGRVQASNAPPKPARPIDRFNTNRIIFGGQGYIRR